MLYQPDPFRPLLHLVFTLLHLSFNPRPRLPCLHSVLVFTIRQCSCSIISFNVDHSEKFPHRNKSKTNLKGKTKAKKKKRNLRTKSNSQLHILFCTYSTSCGTFAYFKICLNYSSCCPWSSLLIPRPSTFPPTIIIVVVRWTPLYRRCCSEFLRPGRKT